MSNFFNWVGYKANGFVVVVLSMFTIISIMVLFFIAIAISYYALLLFPLITILGWYLLWKEYKGKPN
jgi:hypothetical protein